MPIESYFLKLIKFFMKLNDVKKKLFSALIKLIKNKTFTF